MSCNIPSWKPREPWPDDHRLLLGQNHRFAFRFKTKHPLPSDVLVIPRPTGAHNPQMPLGNLPELVGVNARLASGNLRGAGRQEAWQTGRRGRGNAVPHALIIDENITISRGIEACLAALGFASFDHTWSEQQALAAARLHRPDIIVIGDDIEVGSALRAARIISADGTIPVLMVSGDPVRAAHKLAEPHSYHGPMRLNQIEEAVALALRPA
jgi:CheY-like chemotaxis protein